MQTESRPMPDFGLIRTLAREICSRRLQARGPTPSSSLPASTVLEALQNGGSTDGRFASGYLFHSAHITNTLIGAKNCVDIGAAPGCQLLQVAKLNPEIDFIGIDNQPCLIEEGERQQDLLGVSNVRWVNDDVTSLESLASNSIDAVISTMTLHDLPNGRAVEQSLQSISRILSPAGAIYLEDYGRLKSPASVAYFNAVNSAIEGDAFAKLNACSMHAAFEREELNSLFMKYLPGARLHSTFLIPFLNVLKTEARALPEEKNKIIRTMRSNLPDRQKADLDDLRKFFKLGGLKTDPFA